MAVCSRMRDVAGISDVTLSLPHVIGGEAILDTIPLVLDATEDKALCESAVVIHDAIKSL